MTVKNNLCWVGINVWMSIKHLLKHMGMVRSILVRCADSNSISNFTKCDDCYKEKSLKNIKKTSSLVYGSTINVMEWIGDIKMENIQVLRIGKLKNSIWLALCGTLANQGRNLNEIFFTSFFLNTILRAKPKGKKAWERQFKALKKYKKEHNNCT